MLSPANVVIKKSLVMKEKKIEAVTTQNGLYQEVFEPTQSFK